MNIVALRRRRLLGLHVTPAGFDEPYCVTLRKWLDSLKVSIIMQPPQNISIGVLSAFLFTL